MNGLDDLERRKQLFRWLDEPDPYVMGLMEAAERSGVPEVTLRAAAARGSLLAIKVGRVWLTSSRWLGWYLAERRERASRQR